MCPNVAFQPEFDNIGGMDEKEYPKWLSEIAWCVDRLVQQSQNMNRFRQMLRDWYNDNAHRPEYQLLPLEPREHSLREKYVILAAVHDSCCREVKPIHPWTNLPVLSIVGVKYFGLMNDVRRVLTGDDEPALKSFLDSVTRDLPVRQPPKAEQPEETGQGNKLSGKAKKRDDGGEICSEDEFRKFTSIHERLKLCEEELRRPIEERSGKLSLLQIDLDEGLTEFWPVMRKIGQRLDVELPETPELLKDFIHGKEIESLYWDAAAQGGDWCSIDGRDVHITELVKMAEKDDEVQSRPRYELIEKIDKIMVRLCRRFGVDPSESLKAEYRDTEHTPEGKRAAKPIDELVELNDTERDGESEQDKLGAVKERAEQKPVERGQGDRAGNIQGRPWEDVKKDAEKYVSENSFPGISVLQKRMHCSKGTVYKAIRNSQKLQQAKKKYDEDRARQSKKPKAVSLTDTVLASAESSNETEPDKQAEIRILAQEGEVALKRDILNATPKQDRAKLTPELEGKSAEELAEILLCAKEQKADFCQDDPRAKFRPRRQV